jgi:hypothetical protein
VSQTVLNGLQNGDRNGNGFIELSELVAHVQDQGSEDRHRAEWPRPSGGRGARVNR